MTRRRKNTLLCVGEGESECAFLRYLCSIHDYRGKQSIKIENGRGGSPTDVLKRARRISKAYHFDRVLIWIDEDAVQAKEREQLRRAPVTVCCSSPCIEGFLLSLITGHECSDDVSVVKKELQRYIVPTQIYLPTTYGKLNEFALDALNKYCSLAEDSQVRTPRAFYTLHSLISAMFR